MTYACTQQNDKVQKMQATIDSLQKQLNETYKPGFGEFMSGIQTHHAKLWFAGQNQNWELAGFEMHEIKEALDAVQKFCSDRPEVKQMGMMNPAIDTLNNAIQQKDPQSFRNSFVLFTNTCNKCHQATNHAFNVVTVPTNLPVVNQKFKPAQ
jgi:soluble cytochrome b562